MRRLLEVVVLIEFLCLTFLSKPMKTNSELTLVLEFLKRNVIGKSIISPPTITETDHNIFTTAYEEDAVFSNLVQTQHGFSFDMTTLARGTRYFSGSKIRAEGTMNTVRVIRYEMTERLSSGNLIGHAHFISSTNSQPDPLAGTIFLVRMWFANDVLKIEEQHIGYADVWSSEGNFKSVATDGKYTYSIKDGKLVVKYQQKTFYVNPKTLRRVPTKDNFPAQISQEIAFPSELPVKVEF